MVAHVIEIGKCHQGPDRDDQHEGMEADVLLRHLHGPIEVDRSGIAAARGIDGDHRVFHGGPSGGLYLHHQVSGGRVARDQADADDDR